MHVQCKQVELCRFRYGSEFVQTCVDVVSNYMYQSNNFFVVVQLSDKLLATKVLTNYHFVILCIQNALVNLF